MYINIIDNEIIHPNHGKNNIIPESIKKRPQFDNKLFSLHFTVPTIPPSNIRETISKKDEYIKNFWDVVNWEFVNKLYKLKTNKETHFISGTTFLTGLGIRSSVFRANRLFFAQK